MNEFLGCTGVCGKYCVPEYVLVYRDSAHAMDKINWIPKPPHTTLDMCTVPYFNVQTIQAMEENKELPPIFIADVCTYKSEVEQIRMFIAQQSPITHKPATSAEWNKRILIARQFQCPIVGDVINWRLYELEQPIDILQSRVTLFACNLDDLKLHSLEFCSKHVQNRIINHFNHPSTRACFGKQFEDEINGVSPLANVKLCENICNKIMLKTPQVYKLIEMQLNSDRTRGQLMLGWISWHKLLRMFANLQTHEFLGSSDPKLQQIEDDITQYFCMHLQIAPLRMPAYPMRLMFAIRFRQREFVRLSARNQGLGAHDTN